jgi:hypothetical protein
MEHFLTLFVKYFSGTATVSPRLRNLAGERENAAPDGRVVGGGVPTRSADGMAEAVDGNTLFSRSRDAALISAPRRER